MKWTTGAHGSLEIRELVGEYEVLTFGFDAAVRDDAFWTYVQRAGAGAVLFKIAPSPTKITAEITHDVVVLTIQTLRGVGRSL